MSEDALREAVEFFDLDTWLQGVADTRPGGGAERCVRDCPACGNGDYKLYVNTTKKRWLCYVCDWGRGLGDIAVLMAHVAGQSLFDVRKEILASARPLAPTGELEQRLSALMGDAVDALSTPPAVVDVPGDDSFTGSTGLAVLAYARRRGLCDDEIIKYRLRAAYRVPVKDKEFSGPFLVFPNYRAGAAVSWQGRRINDKREPRYVSSDAIATWLWPLDEWALPHLRGARITLVEGTIDSAGLWRHGIPAMATYGKKISDRQIALLRELQPAELVLAWDADSARTSTQRLARGSKGLRGEIEGAALRLAKTFNVSVVDFSENNTEEMDPGDALHSERAADWVRGKLADAMDVRSDRFYVWRLS